MNTLATRKDRHVSPTREKPKKSCLMGRGGSRCSLGRLWRGWPGSALTRRAPKEDPCGPRHRGPRERCGNPSSRGKAGRHSAFVDKLRDYGGHQVRRFLDIDWVKVAHSVTKDTFPEAGQRAALHTVHNPTDPISYGQAKEYTLLKYGHIPEGQGKEAFGPTLADYIWTEISVRAETCKQDAHYKAIDNGLWHTLGSYVEPPPSIRPCLPPNNDHGRNQVGNIYEALVGVVVGGQLPWPHGPVPHPYGSGPDRIRPVVAVRQVVLRRIPARG